MKSQFLAHVSHELRTPLNAIIGFSEILEDQTFGPMNERQARYMQNILKSSRHLLALINDILDLTKVEAAKMELIATDFLLQDLVRNVLDGLDPLAKNKQIQVTHELAEDFPIIEADEGRLRQVLINLLSNAIKFTSEGGLVSVLVDLVEDDFVRVQVRDTGIGIKKEHQDLIFSEFSQVDETYARRYMGTGLGLALTKRLVEMHGGTIWVESVEGEGSTFSFTVPRRQD
jgi:signal transduction histidine kinase